MEHPHGPEKDYRHSGAFSLLHLATQFDEQSFDA